ncbi:MAG: HD domain-containing phosphohydrolase [Pseudomonadota bacterium]
MKLGELKLKDKILILILPVIIISITIATVLSYIMSKQMLANEYKNQKDQVSEHVISAVRIIDSGYGMLDKSIEKEMEKGILVFRDEFQRSGGEPGKVSLDELKMRMGNKYDLIIIDDATTIIKSTIPQGIGFNFMQFDVALGERINEIRMSDTVRHERIRTNVGTGLLSKFSYVASKDHKYVLEISYSEGGLSTLVGELDPLKTTAQLVDTIPIVSRIRIFDVYGYEFVNTGENYEPTGESLEIVDRAKKEKQYEVVAGNKVSSYFFIDLKGKADSLTDNSKIVEIVFDDTLMLKQLNKIALTALSTGAVGVLIAILVIFFLSKKLTQPIANLSAVAQRVAKGDYEVAVEKMSQDEVGELSDAFNSMIGKIRENFEKIERNKTELEDYNKNLEKKVEERTSELIKALEQEKITQKLLENSNLQFENLFHNMQEGFAIFEIICDEVGRPVDYRLLDANKVFADILGLKLEELRDKTALELGFHSSDKSLIEKYGRVALTGEPIHFDNYLKSIGKHFSINVFCPAIGKFAAVYADITSQVLAKEEMKREKYILERILDDTLSGYWDWDLARGTEYLSPGFARMLGYEYHELQNSPKVWRSLIFQEDLPKVLDCFKAHIESKGKAPFYNEVRYLHKDGSTLWSIFSGHVVEWDEMGNPTQMVGCHINITDIKNLQKSLYEERELIKATLMSIGDGVISAGRDGRVEIVNAVAERLTGWTQLEAYGKPFEEVFNIVNEYSGEKCDNTISIVFETGEAAKFTENTIMIGRDGSDRPIEYSAAPIKDESGNINGVVLIFRDFTEKKEKQEKIEFLSFHDQLTGLYNRRFLEEEMRRMDCKRNLPLTLVMLDVNGLKLINDAFGHAMGDKVLQRAACIMQEECRENDVIARFGGDEFVILLPCTRSKDVEPIVKRIYNLIAGEPMESINMSVSYGWATKEKVSERMSDIFKIAEDHMYRRKLSESRSMHYRTIEIILKTLHEKSEREKKHSERVSKLCEALGAACGLDNEEVKELKTTGLMHDIGKIAIDLSILDKPSQLTVAERVEIQRHPELGYQILRSINEFAKCAEYVLAHHERWDGKGYPSALKGVQIPLEARIIAVADAYDAMTSDRAYRKALGVQEAIEELQKSAGKQFDPRIVRIFVEKVICSERTV